MTLQPRDNTLRMENRVFLTLIKLFQMKGMKNQADVTRKYFENLPVKNLEESDYWRFPSKKVYWFTREKSMTSFYNRLEKKINGEVVQNIDHVMTTIREQFGDEETENMHLYFVLASEHEKNTIPLIIGIFQNIIVLNDNGIIIQIDSEYRNHSHKIRSIIKLLSTA